MNILITGGAGFIGSHLAERLLADGHRVMIVDNLSRGRKENVPSGSFFVVADISNPDIVAELEDFKPEVIYHLAAQINLRTSIEDPVADAETNVLGSLRMLQLAQSLGSRFIFASSAAVYGYATTGQDEEAKLRPVTPYGITKHTVENYVRFFADHHKIPVTIFRFANAYGPRQNATGEAGVIASFISGALAGRELSVNGDGRQSRDFLYVSDIVGALVSGLDHEGVYNIGTDKETSLLELLDKIKSLHGQPVRWKHNPPIKGDVPNFNFNTAKARQHLQWLPQVDISSGLAATYAWMKGHQDL